MRATAYVALALALGFRAVTATGQAQAGGSSAEAGSSGDQTTQGDGGGNDKQLNVPDLSHANPKTANRNCFFESRTDKTTSSGVCMLDIRLAEKGKLVVRYRPRIPCANDSKCPYLADGKVPRIRTPSQDLPGCQVDWNMDNVKLARAAAEAAQQDVFEAGKEAIIKNPDGTLRYARCGTPRAKGASKRPSEDDENRKRQKTGDGASSNGQAGADAAGAA